MGGGGNVKGEMKINHVSKIKSEDRWFKKRNKGRRGNRCCQLSPDPCGKAALSLVITAFIMSLYRFGFVIFVFLFNNPSSLWWPEVPSEFKWTHLDPLLKTGDHFPITNSGYWNWGFAEVLWKMSLFRSSTQWPRTALSQEPESSLIWKLCTSSSRTGAGVLHTAENCSVQFLLVAFCLSLDVFSLRPRKSTDQKFWEHFFILPICSPELLTAESVQLRS